MHTEPRGPSADTRAADRRPLLSAELVAVGTELTVGETRDTNGGDLAGELTALGVTVHRLTALRDVLEDVVGTFEDALRRVDLVVTTGGLGPTPDDLTREAIAAVCGETPAVDPGLEAWVRNLFERRKIAFAERNLKQAWLIPSATALPNANGTAPGWWVDRPDGRVIVALPGPPREIGPMWRDEVLPRLRARGAGTDIVVRTVRVTGVGESNVAEALGDEILHAPNPIVATYARQDGIDVRITARTRAAANGDGVDAPAEIAAEMEQIVAERMREVGGYVFGTGSDTWIDVIGRRLAGRRVAIVEAGTAGALDEMLAGADWFAYGEIAPLPRPGEDGEQGAGAAARRVQAVAAAEVGLALYALPSGPDTAVTIAVAIGDRVASVSRVAFLGGGMGKRRAAVSASAELWLRLGEG